MSGEIAMREHSLVPDLTLRLNIEHPALEDVWLEGYKNAEKNITEAANPYCRGSSEYRYWREGWWAAFYGEEPLFSKQDAEQKQATQEKITMSQYKPLVIQNNDPQKIHLIFNAILVLASAVAAYTLYDLVT